MMEYNRKITLHKLPILLSLSISLENENPTTEDYESGRYNILVHTLRHVLPNPYIEYKNINHTIEKVLNCDSIPEWYSPTKEEIDDLFWHKDFGGKDKYDYYKRITNYWNGMVRIIDNNNSVIAYNKLDEHFYFTHDGMYAYKKKDMKKPFRKHLGEYYLTLSYKDSINLFYNYFRSYEIYMDYFVESEEERLKHNPEYPKFKELIVKLENIYYYLVHTKLINEATQPDLSDIGVDNSVRPSR